MVLAVSVFIFELMEFSRSLHTSYSTANCARHSVVKLNRKLIEDTIGNTGNVIKIYKSKPLEHFFNTKIET